jgi:hypothetical protein
VINIILFGCGAIGSQLALHLASEDIVFHLIDDDRVGEDNLLTSAFLYGQIGSRKVGALASLLYRKNKCISMLYDITLTEASYNNIVSSKVFNLALDCFDNAEARLLTCKHLAPTLHIGVSREGTGSITWDEHYKSFEGAPRGEDTFCTHLAGRDILRLTACVAAHVVENYLETGIKESLTITKRLAILR